MGARLLSCVVAGESLLVDVLAARRRDGAASAGRLPGRCGRRWPRRSTRGNWRKRTGACSSAHSRRGAASPRRAGWRAWCRRMQKQRVSGGFGDGAMEQRVGTLIRFGVARCARLGRELLQALDLGLRRAQRRETRHDGFGREAHLDDLERIGVIEHVVEGGAQVRPRPAGCSGVRCGIGAPAAGRVSMKFRVPDGGGSGLPVRARRAPGVPSGDPRRAPMPESFRAGSFRRGRRSAAR